MKTDAENRFHLTTLCFAAVALAVWLAAVWSAVAYLPQSWGSWCGFIGTMLLVAPVALNTVHAFRNRNQAAPGTVTSVHLDNLDAITECLHFDYVVTLVNFIGAGLVAVGFLLGLAPVPPS